MKTCPLPAMLLCSCLTLTGVAALAQGRGPGGGGGMGHPMGGGPSLGQPHLGFPGEPSQNGRGGLPGPNSGANGTNSTMRGGLQLGPPGRWWDNKSFAKSLGLRKDQQKKMDAVFNMSKGSILESYKALQKEESRLETLTKQPKPDEARIFAGIEAVAQARASLEKANAHMLLQVRQEMDADQIARMEKFREQPPDE
ncbi:periplasmic heavy metal sensor [Granulicella sp. dw_53]|uniref:Spy/CpxP family protein refolding chaperone n=1 Tax=Granulicella sp. dw_53 TaxID=2719792 RepID=UPI001BD4B9BC|nr:periplasmic heavy metal sensor [Granulicella sp. dw_53]